MTENTSQNFFPIGYHEFLPQFEKSADDMKNWAKASDNAMKIFLITP
jgi:hypothetical protein